MEKIEFFPLFFAPLVALIVLVLEFFTLSIEKFGEPAIKETKLIGQKIKSMKAKEFGIWINRLGGCGYLSKRMSAYSYRNYKRLEVLLSQLEPIPKRIKNKVERFQETFIIGIKRISIVYGSVLICYLCIRFGWLLFLRNINPKALLLIQSFTSCIMQEFLPLLKMPEYWHIERFIVILIALSFFLSFNIKLFHFVIDIQKDRRLTKVYSDFCEETTWTFKITSEH